MNNSIDEVEKLYGKVIAVQDDVYWTAKVIVIKNQTTFIAVERNPPLDALVESSIKDLPGQQRLF